MSSQAAARESTTLTVDRIAAKSANLAVVGLGTIGLPLATFSAARGFRVVGLDVDPKRVQDVNTREVLFEYSEILKDLPLSSMKATTDPADLRSADVLFFCVPTPVDDKGYIMLDRLASAAKAVGPHLKRGALVVLESSVEIGTTRWFAERIQESSGLRPGQDFHVAYCPERYNPGLPTEEHAQVIYGKRVKLAGPLSYHNVNRVVGGVDAVSGQLAHAVYSTVLEANIKPVSSVEVAEAAKLMENIFRDVNIALVNEFAETLDALGVDTYEVVRAAATKSFAFLPHFPGLVGGECIPVDTWYLIRQAERAGVDCRLMRKAREVNDSVVDRVVDAACALVEKGNAGATGAKIAILGTAYKANVFDDRVSPSRRIAEALLARGHQPVLCDPVVKRHNHRTRDVLVDLDDALQGASVAILATDHAEFKALVPEAMAKKMADRNLVDARNALDHAAFRKAGFAVVAWGRKLDG